MTMHTATGSQIFDKIDAVVFLTWSDWRTEPRSNRYHFAKRFAQHRRVFFVQPDLETPTYKFEQSEIPNVVILKVPRQPGTRQSEVLSRALSEVNVLDPLLWIYNPTFIDFIALCHSPMKVFHATEDYFQPELARQLGSRSVALLQVLKLVDCIVAVSEGVADSYRTVETIGDKVLVLENGVDFDFFRDAKFPKTQPRLKRAIFQGGINYRLDFELLSALAKRKPNWEFFFCGAIDPACSAFVDLCRENPNIRSEGFLTPDRMKDSMMLAHVGIIPFVQTDLIVQKSLPLKSFEYLACGLPVVSVPIRSLERFGDSFLFAATISQWDSQLDRAYLLSQNEEYFNRQRLTARAQDYDTRFSILTSHLDSISIRNSSRELAADRRLNLLVLYSANSTHVGTVRDYLECFSRYSSHKVFYLNAVGTARASDSFSAYDAIFIHYSVRLSLPDYISKDIAEKLTAYPGFKILSIQDEYEDTNQAIAWVQKLGIHHVLTCVPKSDVEKVYSSKRLPHVKFTTVLTGYVPERLAQLERSKIPISQRKIWIAYRGRRLHPVYGMLGFEKYFIGEEMKRRCFENQIPADISSDESDRIYGDKWFDFLASARATLGTESGSNIFDFDGSIRESLNRRGLSDIGAEEFREIYDKELKALDGLHATMNQLSPKMFESICLGTALILFEGEYSGILEPDVHYVSLKKDFSNFDDVVRKIADTDFLENMAKRAYEDIVASGRYSYASFVRTIDDMVNSEVRTGPVADIVSGFGVASNRSNGRMSKEPMVPLENFYFRGDVPPKLHAYEYLELTADDIRFRFAVKVICIKLFWKAQQLGRKVLGRPKYFLDRVVERFVRGARAND